MQFLPDILNNIKASGMFSTANEIASFIVSCLSIITTIIAAFSKRRSARSRIEDPSTPIEVRYYLQDRWTGRLFMTKVISGVITAVLVTLFITFVMPYIIGFITTFPTFLHQVTASHASAGLQQVQRVSTNPTSPVPGPSIVSNPIAIVIGAVLGLLIGIRVGTSTALKEAKNISIAEPQVTYSPSSREN